MLRVLHLDDDVDHYEWTRRQLSRLDRDIELVRAGNLEEAALNLESADFHCVLTDDQQPGKSLDEVVSFLLSHAPAIEIIVLTDRDLIDDVAYKEASIEGVEYVPFGRYDMLLEFIRKMAGTASRTAPSAAPDGMDNKETELLDRLSRRETEVLLLIARGNSNKEIAYELGISYHTVVNHVRNLFEKLEVHNRTEATRIALRYREKVAGPLGMGLPDKLM